MESEFINLTSKNIENEHLCCIIRSRKPHPGVEAKRKWLSARLEEGHVFRKLDVKGCCFIEYAPVETAWVPVIGDNFYYIYCLWVSGEFKGKGYGKSLMEYCIAEQELTIYYDSQCPFIYQKLEEIRRYCEEHAVPVNLIQVDTLQKAKDLPCVFNNWGAFYKGKFVSVNLLDKTALISLILQNK